MVREGLFDDLPAPIAHTQDDDATCSANSAIATSPPLTKSALKRPSQTDEHHEGLKRVRFKTTMDASALQIADAMRKIATHIGNPMKFSKAAKLALQLLQSKSLNKDNSDLFFNIMKASMVLPISATTPHLRQDYHELFSAVSEQLEFFSPLQQAQLELWMLWSQVANDFYTDDTFVFSKASSKVKQIVSSLPELTAAEDVFDTAGNSESQGSEDKEDLAQETEADNDPFGLNALLTRPSKKEERINKKKEEDAASRKAQVQEANLLRERREALMLCLEIAAGRYRMKWAQTIIDILVKHAFDNISKFTAQQRVAIENLWASVREQQIKRKQGKTGTGRLDMTGFERFQNQYSQAKISIRHSVGADGDRGAEQWLG